MKNKTSYDWSLIFAQQDRARVKNHGDKVVIQVRLNEKYY